MAGKAFQTLSVCKGVMALFQEAGFEKTLDNHLVLPTSADMEKVEAMLAHILDMSDIRAEEKKQADIAESLKRQKEKEKQKEQFHNRFHADRKEASTRPVVASHAATTKFSGEKKDFSAIGVNLNQNRG